MRSVEDILAAFKRVPPKFLTYGDSVIQVNRYLIVLVAVLAATSVLLAFTATKAKYIYIDPSQITGVARVGYVPQRAVEDFASYFVSRLMNVTPEDALAQYRAAYVLMSPQLASKMKGVLEGEIKTLQTGDMFISTIPTRVTVARSAADTFNLTVLARKDSFSFGKLTSERFLEITLVVKKTAPKELNPFGLEVQSYDYREVDRTAVYGVPTAGAPQS